MFLVKRSDPSNTRGVREMMMMLYYYYRCLMLNEGLYMKPYETDD